MQTAFQSENLERLNHLGNLGVDGSLILNCVLKKLDMRVLTGIMLPGRGSSGWFFVNRIMRNLAPSVETPLTLQEIVYSMNCSEVEFTSPSQYLTNKLYGAESLRSRQLTIYSRTSQYFMECEGSLPCSQQPSTSPYSEPDQFSPYHPSLSLQDPF
jgi:hypothetical protein